MAQGTDTLRVFDFGLLFQALAQSLKVGVLKVSSRHGEKYLHFARGRLKCIYTRRSRIRIGRILYNMRAVELADLSKVMEDKGAGRSSLPMGEELVARGLVSAQDLEAAVRYQMTEELLEIFYWREYSYEFFGGPVEKTVQQVAGDFTRVGGDQEVQQLLLNVSKIVDDIEKFNQMTPSLRDVYELCVDPETYLESEGRPPALVELLRLIDGRRDIRELLKDMRLNRFDVLELLFRLRVGGVIRPKNPFELLMLAENQRKTLPAEKVVRIYERVQELGVEGFNVTLRLAQACEEAGEAGRAAGHYVSHARAALESGELDSAGKAARRAVDLFPRSPEWRELLIETLLAAGSSAEAAAELSSLAGICRDAKDTEKEAEVLARALALSPCDEDLLVRRAKALEKLGQARKAAGTLLYLARLRAASGNQAGVHEALQAAVQARPDGICVRARLVSHLAAESRAKEAAEVARGLVLVAWERSERAGWKPSRALAALRGVLGGLGVRDLPLALMLADAFSRCGETAVSRDVLSETAAYLKESGRLVDCREALEHATEIVPEDPGLGERLADVLAEVGERDEAVARYRGLARSCIARKSPAEAERLFRRALALRPVAPETMVELAELLAGCHREVEAARIFAQVGYLYRAANQGHSAVEFFDRACGLDPTEPAYLRALAEGLGESLQVERSVEFFDRLVQVHLSRGEHAAALEAGLRIIDRPGAPDRLTETLRESWRAVGERLDARVPA